MPHPSTPSKADDGIEQLKISLSQQWGIHFPPRDPNWSPSRRDPNRVEDRISARIQFLYFKDGALPYAINDFEKKAAVIYSSWQYKPRGDPDVLPSRAPGASALRQDFLRKRAPLHEGAARLLAESLLLCLDQAAERVRSGENFPTIEKKKSTKTVSVQSTPKSEHQRHHQSSIKQWLRSRSDPNAWTGGPMAAGGHPSSDDFNDEDMADAFVEMSKHDSTPDPVHLNYQKKLGATPPGEDVFETPPTTPPQSEGAGLGLRIGLDERLRDSRSLCQPKPELAAVNNKKRPSSDVEPMKPPAMRRISREMSNVQGHLNPPVPMPPPDGYGSTSRSPSLSRSYDNISSISSSMTSPSPAWTSPNTSFCSESLATSFDSTAEETDTTVRPSFGQPRSRYPSGQSSLWSVGKSKDHRQNGNNVSLSGAVLASNSSTKRSNVQPNVYVSSAMDLEMTGAAIPSTETQRVTSPSTMANLAKRLISQTPFVPIDDDIAAIPFRQLYEIIRVSLHGKLSPIKISYLLAQTYESYDAMWSAIWLVIKGAGAQLPERSSPVAWKRAEQTFEGVAISGKLVFREQPGGPLFEFKLNPLKLESSYRFSRKFGSDRFCVITIPGLGPENLPADLKSDHAAVRNCIIRWLVDTEHHFLGRKWRVFYTKPDAAKRRLKLSRSAFNDAKYRVYFFAEDGIGFRQEAHTGEQDPRRPYHMRMTVEQLIQWFMPLKLNQNQPSLKLFARLALGVSDTISTVVFNPQEIIRCDDARADSVKVSRVSITRSDEKKRHLNAPTSKAPVMNDGCSRISRPAALAIAHMLGMDHAPSVYQGRIAGAKGVWMVHPLDEKPPPKSRNYWIEINDSQLKFEGHAKDAIFPDEERVTFEVNDYSRRLTPSSLNFQLMPILADRGVPIGIFRDRLEEDLTLRVSELKVAMDSSLALRKWNQENNPVSADRARYGGIEMQGGLPLSKAEKINWFLEHGFEAKLCQYLKQQLWEAIHSYCLRLENKMSIGVGRSTYAFMIADPLAILEEDEIHLGFSNSFRDTKSGFDETMLHDIDVLVARLPAHLPSDVQKVRAIFRPELRVYRDVIVFPSKGSVSLASKLSGGDYDGDKAWVCWDPDIVKPFKNAAVPDFPPLDFYGIEKDNTKVADHLAYPDYMNRFLGQAFNFNLQSNMLGPCTNYHEAFCYLNNAIDSPPAINIAVLLGNLVDSAKGGFIFDDPKWTSFLKKNGLPLRLQPPAYKNRDKAKPTNHMIDQLVFEVAKKIREKALGDFDDRFREAVSWDRDLVRIRNNMADHATSDESLALVLKNLELDLEGILRFWMNNARPEDENDETRPPRKGNALSFRAVVEKCRGDFLSLRPRTDELSPRRMNMNTNPNVKSVTAAVVLSERVRQWQEDYSSGSNNSPWALVKASVAFHHHHKRAFVWHLAGIELGEMKAMAKGKGTFRVVINELFDAFKLDSKLVDGVKRREMERDADLDMTIGEDGVMADDAALLEDIDWDEGMSQL